ncbi:MAG: hypothetical protein COA78_12895 [Blastopirellula sp.]|nr:MAG: hypothetical protein COA78_12895 [Blastopirellula sp.]
MQYKQISDKEVLNFFYVLLLLAGLAAWFLYKALYLLIYPIVWLVVRGIERTFNVSLASDLEYEEDRYVLSRLQTGWVYVLSNPSIPGQVKIGFTDRADYQLRVDELNSSTSIPTPFKIEYLHPSSNPHSLEQKLHRHFSNDRVNKGREFFTVTPDQVKTAIVLLEN